MKPCQYLSKIIRLFKIVQILERWQSRMPQECLPTYITTVQEQSDVTMSELWSLLKGLQFPGENLDDKLRLILVNFTTSIQHTVFCCV